MSTRYVKICNICGKEFNKSDYDKKIKIITTCGPGSKHDGNLVIMDICCDCMDKLIDNCVESPLICLDGILDDIPVGEYSYPPDMEDTYYES